MYVHTIYRYYILTHILFIVYRHICVYIVYTCAHTCTHIYTPNPQLHCLTFLLHLIVTDLYFWNTIINISDIFT